MSENQKKQLEQQLWNIANTLRGKMNADEFRDYILGFIFYKYLAEKMELYANDILQADGIAYKTIKEPIMKDTYYNEHWKLREIPKSISSEIPTKKASSPSPYNLGKVF